MDHWNKGGLSREEFLRMRENALRQLQELAKKQQAFANVDKAPAQNSNVMKNSSEKVLSARPEEKPQQTAPEKMQDAAVARPKEADLQTPPILPDRPDRLDAGDFYMEAQNLSGKMNGSLCRNRRKYRSGRLLCRSSGKPRKGF